MKALDWNESAGLKLCELMYAVPEHRKTHIVTYVVLELAYELAQFTDSRHIDKEESCDVVIFRSISLVNE